MGLLEIARHFTKNKESLVSYPNSNLVITEFLNTGNIGDSSCLSLSVIQCAAVLLTYSSPGAIASPFPQEFTSCFPLFPCAVKPIKCFRTCLHNRHCTTAEEDTDVNKKVGMQEDGWG